jgi:ribosomal protein L6P/L9E
LTYTHPNGVNVAIEENQVKVSIESDEYRNYWGLVRTLIANMIEGVTN